ncbi:exodeoxyribonuclease V subunit beta [Alloalcanivorax xenomutans]|uniref:exodeoxyribonuclease V subunit beta n=1 Tax=Alloalcanivorax xenomutans TaxID=1094342 RepID=UPI0029352AF2|nr:exodeoxyribonuclease V subunit beta [Alloalcanivorax xenomutans]WOD27122.1 exodeoxyribonuclease V subunit beta [Alloalcanivorax xenomutans]
MSQPRPLPLTFPLHGTRLIEASAGTGKTFTLAALYLRLVLGHGGQAAFRQPLLPPEILVVTFTEAATEELRERIRDRLAEAARVFAAPQAHKPDVILQGLLDDYADDEQRRHCAQRLNAAAQWMDEAAIYTIHGFCNRMLKQHAFDSGSLFSLELQEDASDEQQLAACDYWRNVIAGFPVSAANALQASKLGHPEALLAQCRPLLGLGGTDPDTLPESVQRWLDASGPQAALEQSARATLNAELPALFDWVRSARDNKWLNGNSYRASSLPGMLLTLERYAAGEVLSDKDYDTLSRFSTTGMKLTKKGEEHRPGFAFCDQLDQVLEQREQTALPRTDLLAHAAAWIGKRVDRMRRQTATMGFDDMLSRLHGALHGDNGARLAQVIRDQFPVALIDEFQDTDPTQYGIFSALYQHRDDTGWFMIGDPKQAIYAFRGADVFTYLQARRATEGHHYTLGRNFRSATQMVAAVNRLFEYSQDTHGDVFMMDNAIPFEAVEAQGRKDTLLVDGEIKSGVTLWVEDSDKAISSGVYRQHQAARCATEITHLLNGAGQGVTGFREGQRFTPLRPRDIAVLVRDRTEARAIRDTLLARGVRSVYLSDQDSVFAQPEAQDLLLILRACASPESDVRVRSALASGTLSLPYQELDRINRDEVRWEAMVNRFHGYREQWRQQGVLPMFRGLLMDFSVPARLQRSLDGERAFTNLLHLAELLQQAATQLDGEQALIRYLEDTVNDQRGSNNDSILRLESDDDRVKVITIHKSKGLEYPVVYLPFICSFRAAEKSKPPLRYHRKGQDNAHLVVSLEPDDDIERLADHERLAEDMRLLYVALTRACHSCTLGLAPYAKGRAQQNQLPRSAIGRLLFGPQGVANDQLLAALGPLSDDAITVIPAPPGNDEVYQPVNTVVRLREPEIFPRHPRTPWWIASYSALRQMEEPLAPADARADQLAETEPEPVQKPMMETATAGVHAFPRGALPGTLLHDLLEHAANQGFRTCLDAPEEMDKRVRQQLEARHWQDHNTTVMQWWRRTLTTPLPLQQERIRLADLDRPVAEMEFLLPAEQVPVTRLDALIREHLYPGQPRPRLEADTLNGMLKGFMDLVFEHRGRYYVLDYKSNWLGPDDDAYGDDALIEALLEHRYEVQYALYLLALHRLLRSRLGNDYHPDAHLGGAVYVFLRGLGAPSAGTVFSAAPTALVEALDRLFLGDAHAK